MNGWNSAEWKSTSKSKIPTTTRNRTYCRCVVPIIIAPRVRRNISLGSSSPAAAGSLHMQSGGGEGKKRGREGGCGAANGRRIIWFRKTIVNYGPSPTPALPKMPQGNDGTEARLGGRRRRRQHAAFELGMGQKCVYV